MEVVLIGMTINPQYYITHKNDAEDICAQAMLGCQSTKAAFEIYPSGEKVQEMMKMSIESGHESVLEHANFTFSVKGISRACSHQLVRHRIASYSQQSQRHVNPTKTDDWFVMPDSIIGCHATDVNMDIYIGLMKACADFYQRLVHCGIPEEDARFVLPNACKTNIVITMNARELRHFFKLRRAESAQWEIRSMANEMFRLVCDIAPNIFKR